MPGRRKRFDALLAEHKNRARERERERELHQPHSQQNPSLRDSHPSTHLIADTYQVAQGNGLAPDATKPVPLIKPRFNSLPRYVLLQIISFFVPAGVANSVTFKYCNRYPVWRVLYGFLKQRRPSLSRLNSHGAGTPGDATLVPESPHHPPTMPDGFSRHSSDEGENEEREEVIDKLDCHYSGYHPRPVAVSTLLVISIL